MYNVGDYIHGIGRISTVSINFKNPAMNMYEVITNGNVKVYREADLNV
jgi:hypothetical protein